MDEENYMLFGDNVVYNTDSKLNSPANYELISKLKGQGFICKRENESFLWFGYKKINRTFDDFDESLKTFNGQLLSFQYSDTLKLLNNDRCILASSVGTGKTIVSLALINYLLYKNKESKILIVVPKSIISQWIEQAKTFINIDIIPYGNDAFDNAGIKIISYGRLRTGIFKYKKFDLVLFDEASNIKSIKSKQSKEACLIKSTKKVLITATPIKNNCTEIFSLMKVLDSSSYLFNNYSNFVNDYTEQKYIFSIKRTVPIGYKNLEQLKKKISPFIIKSDRNSPEIQKQIGQKFDIIEENRIVNLSKPQDFNNELLRNKIFNLLKNLKEDITDSEIDSAMVGESTSLDEFKQLLLPIFTFMRLNADSTELLELSDSEKMKEFSFYSDVLHQSNKIQELLEILDELEGKTVIFTCFSKMADIIEKRLKEAGIQSIKTTGQTQNNDKLIEEFKISKTKNVLISTDINKAGVNLQVAQNIVNFDLPFTDADYQQRIGRVSRIGQKFIPIVINIISKDTIDEKILSYIQKKRLMNQSLI